MKATHSDQITSVYNSKMISMALAVLFFCIGAVSKAQPIVNSSNWVKLNILNIDAQAFPKVVMTFSAKNKNGSQVAGINKDDIQLLENGKSVGIANFQSVISNQPLYVSIVVDHSGSMEEDPALLYDKNGNPLYTVDANDKMITPSGYISPLDHAKLALKQFVTGFNAQKDLLSITGFGSEVDEPIALTSNQDALITAMGRMQPAGKTALYDGMMKGLDQLKDVKGIKTLVVLTDGQDNRSISTLNQVISNAQKKNVRIYIIGMGKVNETALQKITEATNGEYFHIHSASSLSAVYTSISRRVQSVYQIEYISPNSTASAKEVSLYANIKNAVVVESWATFTRTGMSTLSSGIPASEEEAVSRKANKTNFNSCYLIYGNASVAALTSIATTIHIVKRLEKKAPKKRFS
jgi:VWFA-related protein